MLLPEPRQQSMLNADVLEQRSLIQLRINNPCTKAICMVWLTPAIVVENCLKVKGGGLRCRRGEPPATGDRPPTRMEA